MSIDLQVTETNHWKWVKIYTQTLQKSENGTWKHLAVRQLTTANTSHPAEAPRNNTGNILPVTAVN